ncbi:superoxide dismutase [Lachnospiraceae bacterium ASD3451]|uniref:superoxide dismutase n=1 Tax=Diplocloster agilis TaxID=2850323 RepID=UPI001D2D1323|nr:superoxide dismutase [Diplocloster agilis]MBU9743301.1 superoxide dismutase [Diplocloster agilis]
MNQQHYPFTLPPLPYTYDALEPAIDMETLHFHHDKHFKTYVDNLNKALENHPEYHDWTLPMLLSRLDELPEDLQKPVRNNGGGVLNHAMYFDSMRPGKNEPSGAVRFAIESQYGSIDHWKSEMKTAALGQFGSGYAWLVKDENQHLKVINLPNQDSPLTYGYCPLLLVDVWEHAYYLKYQNLRADYVDAWFGLINWDVVNSRFAE